MLFKRIPVIIVCMAISITSGGCMSRGERLAYAWKSDQEQSDEIMENIVKALEDKDFEMPDGIVEATGGEGQRCTAKAVFKKDAERGERFRKANRRTDGVLSGGKKRI